MIDTHAHLMFPEFKDGFEDVLKHAAIAGVSKIINVGCDEESSAQAVKMALQYDFLYATVGLHPYDAEEASREIFDKWERIILGDGEGRDAGPERYEGAKKIVAIGETGLDYIKAEVDKEKQKQSFRMHLELAQKVNLPVVVHNRGADEDCFELLREFPKVRAVFHCYTSNLEFARRVWEAGYFTSFTGIITYPSAVDLGDVVKNVPMDKFLVETDCPFLAPQKYRGKRNEPAYVAEVVKCIAEVKEMSMEEIDKVSTNNATGFFKM